MLWKGDATLAVCALTTEYIHLCLHSVSVRPYPCITPKNNNKYIVYLSSEICIYCKSLRIKASAKCPKCKCEWIFFFSIPFLIFSLNKSNAFPGQNGIAGDRTEERLGEEEEQWNLDNNVVAACQIKTEGFAVEDGNHRFSRQKARHIFVPAPRRN